MMKFLTTALGGLTIATVTGLALLPGHAMLGVRQPAPPAPVSVISDPGSSAVVPVSAPVTPPAAPVAVPAARPVVTPAATPVVTHPAPAVSHPAVSHPAPAAQPVARPVPRPAAPATAAPAANPMGGMAGAGAITQLLLNMPQVLQGGQGGPQVAPGAPGGGFVPPGQRGRDSHHKHHGNGDDNNAGDFEH